jgi:hypothetical protein
MRSRKVMLGESRSTEQENQLPIYVGIETRKDRPPHNINSSHPFITATYSLNTVGWLTVVITATENIPVT